MKPLSLISSLFITTTLTTPALAQITVDGTTDSSLTPLDNGVQIDEGNRAGGNLFHSFGEFSVPTGSEAFFNNASDIVNIFSRVTGGNISNIDGLLRANGAANLFMINPAGIIFGENASLNIGGSFYGSSADSIVFPEGEFSATDLANPPLITINAPIGLGIRDNPGDVVNRSTANGVGLLVNEGQTISLIGGNVNIENGGIIFAPGGRVELGGLTEAGTVNFNDDGSLIFPDGIARGDISITGFSTVAVFSGDGGSIGVNANNFELSSGSNIVGGIAAGRGSVGAQAGDIVINATESVLIDGQGDLNTGISVSVFANSIGNAGNIDITTDNFVIDNGTITTSNAGQGDAGSISIAVSDEFTANNGSFITSNIGSPTEAPAIGKVGNMEITAREISLDNRAQIQAGAFSGATAEGSGTVSLTATESISFTGTNTGIFANNASGSFGNASSVVISTDNFLIDNGTINTSNAGQGDAGNISIAVSDQFTATSSVISSNIGDIFGVPTVGKVGNIEITAREIAFDNGANIQAGAFSGGTVEGTGTISLTATESISFTGNSAIFGSNDPGSFGNASSVVISADNLVIDNGTITTSNAGQGDAGNISIAVSDGFTATNGSFITSNIGSPTEAPAVGKVGNIEITAREIFLDNRAQIQVGAFSEGTVEGTGTVSLTATESISFTGTNTGIFANNASGSFGNASDAQLSAPTITIEDGGTVTSRNSGQGDAANIAITTDNFLLDGGIISNTNAGQGDAGNISIAVNDQFTATNESIISSNIGSPTEAPAVGKVGNIEITAREIAFDNGANIQAGAFSGGTVEGTGTISLTATESISFTGNAAIFGSNDPGSFGNASSVVISADNFLIDNGTITTSNAGQGDAGNISIAVSDGFTATNGSFITSNIGSPTEAPAVGKVGNIEITAREIFLDNRAQIQAGAFSEGTVEGTGTVSLTATESISFTGTNTGILSNNASGSFGNASNTQLSAPTITIEDGGTITSANLGQGDSGSISLTTDNFLLDGGIISSTNEGQGDAGSISITVSDQFTATNSVIANNIGDRFGAPAVGRVGSIEITASEISFDNRAQVQAGAFSGATAEEAGIVSLTATESISFAGSGTGIFTNNEPGSFGNASNAQLSAPTITIEDGAFITSTNLGQGDAGSIEISTNNFLINDGSITTSNAGQGDAGSISIAVSDKFTATNSIISNNIGDRFGAPTIGRVGNIEITAREISFDNRAQIQAGAFSSATAEEAGIVSLTATESISFTGSGTGIFTNNDPGSFGSASNVQLLAPTINLNNSAGITASNDANGQGGNVNIEAVQFNLTNDARILANAAGSGNGGNITLNINEDITLRDNSFISARAFEDADGGNLNINSRFIIAFPSQGNGNDIIATAERGNGGNININARQLFNLQEGNAIDSEGNFFSNNRNDIDASSQAEGLDGTVTINNPDVDPLRGATELPTNPVSSETVANNACSTTSNSEQQNTFVVKGKGGVPPLPTATFSAEPLLTENDTSQSNVSGNNNVNQPVNPYYIPANIKPFATDRGNIYPARGVIKTADGKIILTAYSTNSENTRTPHDSIDCN